MKSLQVILIFRSLFVNPQNLAFTKKKLPISHRNSNCFITEYNVRNVHHWIRPSLTYVSSIDNYSLPCRTLTELLIKSYCSLHSSSHLFSICLSYWLFFHFTEKNLPFFVKIILLKSHFVKLFLKISIIFEH